IPKGGRQPSSSELTASRPIAPESWSSTFARKATRKTEPQGGDPSPQPVIRRPKWPRVFPKLTQHEPGTDRSISLLYFTRGSPANSICNPLTLCATIEENGNRYSL